jgi:hypothetical protein
MMTNQFDGLSRPRAGASFRDVWLAMETGQSENPCPWQLRIILQIYHNFGASSDTSSGEEANV